jgi:hypothetical protein
MKFRELLEANSLKSLEDKLTKKLDSLSLEKEKRKMKKEHVQSQKEMKLASEIDELRIQITKLEK